MVLEIGPDTTQIFDHGDVESLKDIARPDAAELQDLGGVDSARGEDDFVVGEDGELLRRVASAVHLDSLGRRLPDLHPANVAVDEEVQIGPMLDRVVVRPARRTSGLVLAVGTDRLPGDTEEVAVHAAIIAEQEAQVFCPRVVDAICNPLAREPIDDSPLTHRHLAMSRAGGSPVLGHGRSYFYQRCT